MNGTIRPASSELPPIAVKSDRFERPGLVGEIAFYYGLSDVRLDRDLPGSAGI